MATRDNFKVRMFNNYTNVKAVSIKTNATISASPGFILPLTIGLLRVRETCVSRSRSTKSLIAHPAERISTTPEINISKIKVSGRGELQLAILIEMMRRALILLIFISGVVLMRSAGCAINDFVDRDLDTNVSRTRNRPIVNGSIKPGEALIVALVLILTAFILVLLLNTLTLKLSLVAIVLVIAYPFMKRFTYLPQFFLGLTFGWAIPMAFAAQTNTVPVIAWLLLMATVLWAVAYDTMYAMVDREDDIRAGIKSTAILFDDTDRVIIGVIQLIVLLTLIMIGFRLDMGMFYYASVAIAGILSIYQQFLIKDRLPENCLKAFTNNNWIGAAIFAGIYLNYQLI